ncbi:hypothetical protein Droror1_Dr00012420 [Drosera rotundifolia]
MTPGNEAGAGERGRSKPSCWAGDASDVRELHGPRRFPSWTRQRNDLRGPSKKRIFNKAGHQQARIRPGNKGKEAGQELFWFSPSKPQNSQKALDFRFFHEGSQGIKR